MHKYRHQYLQYRTKVCQGLEYLPLQWGPTEQIYWQTIPKIYRNVHKLCHQEYHCPLDPFKIATVDPDRIERITGRSSALLQRWSIGRVQKGNWDKKGKANWTSTDPNEPIEQMFSGKWFTDTIFYRSIERHFLDKIPWEDTELFEILTSDLDGHKVIMRDCQTKSDILDRFEEIDQLYSRVKNRGYKTQRELRKSKPNLYDIYGFLGELTNEICVDIGRNGKLLFVDGKHRLTIAKILDIKKIPIVFLTRHEKWMDYRDQVCYNDMNINHPDLNKI